MTKPWETQPDHFDFEADGLPCVVRRGPLRVWCGYVGIGPAHPLFGLPTNHLLKLPLSWFEGRKGLQGLGPIDLFEQILSGRTLEDGCPISLAFEVHGGVDFAEDYVPARAPDRHWWFGFNCGHAGDFVPGRQIPDEINQMIDSLPEDVRHIMRGMIEPNGVYRDPEYATGECQSLAAQLVAVTKLIENSTRARTS
jgi:hypothetical protein